MKKSNSTKTLAHAEQILKVRLAIAMHHWDLLSVLNEELKKYNDTPDS